MEFNLPFTFTAEAHFEWGIMRCDPDLQRRETRVFDRDSQDLFLGKKALDKNLISPVQLREAMSEQARSRTPSGSRHVPLGEVFIARNYMSRDQLLALLDETARITDGTVQGRDSVLGRILIQNRTITPEHLQECLQIQDEHLRSGEIPGPRLGEL